MDLTPTPNKNANNPWRAWDFTIRKSSATAKTGDEYFSGLGRSFMKKDATIKVPITAITAAAKLGFPTVPIIELYGLFHFTKSFPFVCINAYIAVKAAIKIVVLINLFATGTTKESAL